MNNEIATYTLPKNHVMGNYKLTCIGLIGISRISDTINTPCLQNMFADPI